MSDWYYTGIRPYTSPYVTTVTSWTENSDDVTKGTTYDGGYSWQHSDAANIEYIPCYYCKSMHIELDMLSLGNDGLICPACYDYLFDILYTLNRNKKRKIVIPEKKEKNERAKIP